jgi:hypothetical protein
MLGLAIEAPLLAFMAQKVYRLWYVVELKPKVAFAWTRWVAGLADRESRPKWPVSAL